MKVTEADALTKWCPFARVYAFSVPTTLEGREVVGPAATGGPANRYIGATNSEGNPDMARCMGSMCMAWAWISPERTVGCCALAHERN